MGLLDFLFERKTLITPRPVRKALLKSSIRVLKEKRTQVFADAIGDAIGNMTKVGVREIVSDFIKGAL